jgi:hypothetical protein
MVNAKKLVAFLFLSLLAVAPVPAGQSPAFPLDEIEPGLRGYALTVLQGTEPDTLPIEVIGMAPGRSPGSHLILVRGHGKLEETGIAAGMSGSPVFIGERLLGALAFAFVGAKVPIAGVTPFVEMEAALEGYFGAQAQSGTTRGIGGSNFRPDLPAFPEWRRMCSEGVAFCAPSAGQMQTPPQGFAHIGLPVLVDAGGGGATDALLPALEAVGLAPVLHASLPIASSPAAVASAHKVSGRRLTSSEAAGSRAAAHEASGGTTSAAPAAGLTPLRPGDTLTVDLIAGDMRMSAIGTVTWVDGQNVLAFGHPFMFAGAVELPVSRGRVHTIVPTRSVSFKIGSAVNEVGALIGDKRTGVGVILGHRAPRVPLDLTLRNVGPEGEEKHYHFDIARHELMTGLLLSTAVGSALTDQEYALGLSTLASEIAIELDDGRVVRRNDLFRTLSPAQTIAAEVMAPVTYLIAGTYATFPVRAVRVDLELTPELLAAQIERVRVPKTKVRAGDTLPVEIGLRQHRRGYETHKVTLQVPATVRGTQLQVRVGSAQAFYEWDKERAPDKHRPRTLDDLARLIETYPTDESLIVRLYAPSRGIVIRGREVPSLPLSKWRTLSESATGGDASPVGGLILDEVVLELGEVVLGGSMISLQVEE